MAPPVKAHKNSKNYREYLNRNIPNLMSICGAVKTDRSMWSPLVSAFLPEIKAEQNDKGETESEFRSKLNQAINKLGYDKREGNGWTLLLYMLGQENGNGSPRFTIEDILAPDKLRNEKQEAYKAFTQVQNETQIKQIDKAYLRGSLAAMHYIDKIVSDAINNPDNAPLLFNDTKTRVMLHALNSSFNSINESELSSAQKRFSDDKALNNNFAYLKNIVNSPNNDETEKEASNRVTIYSILSAIPSHNSAYNIFEDGIFKNCKLSSSVVTYSLSNAIAMSILQKEVKLGKEPHQVEFPQELFNLEIPKELNRIINADNKDLLQDFEEAILQPEISELMNSGSSQKAAEEQVKQKLEERKAKLNKKIAPLRKLQKEIGGNAQLMAGMLVMSRCGNLFSGSVIPGESKNGQLVLTDIDAINISIPTKEELYRACIESGIQYDMEKCKDAFHYNDLVKAGLVKLPPRKESYDAQSTIDDRSNVLQELENEIKANSVFKPSVEWQLMEKSFARVKRANEELTKGIQSPEKMTALADAMADLQAAADRYLQFKLAQPDISKSINRVNLANRIIQAAQREANQLAPLAKEHREHYRKDLSSNKCLLDQMQTLSTVLEEFAAVSGSSTQKFVEMEKALKEAQKSADNLAELIKKSGPIHNNLTPDYYDYQKKLYTAQQKVEEYLAHKELNNNHSVRSERRIVVAKEAKAFLDSALSTITFRTVYGSLNDTISPAVLTNSIEPQELHHSMLKSYPNLLDVSTQPPCTTRNELNNRLEKYRDAMMPLLTIACLKGTDPITLELRQEVQDILKGNGEMQEKFDKIAALEVKNGDKTYRPFANVIAYAASNPGFLVENFALDYSNLMQNLSSTFTPDWQNTKMQSLTEQFGPIELPNVVEKVVQPNPNGSQDASHKKENNKLLNKFSHKDHSLDEANPKELASKKEPEHSPLISGMIEKMDKYELSDAIKQPFNEAVKVLEGSQNNVQFAQRQEALGTIMFVGVLLGARNTNVTLSLEGNCEKYSNVLPNIVNKIANLKSTKDIAGDKAKLDNFLNQKTDGFLSEMYGRYTESKKLSEQSKKEKQNSINSSSKVVEEKADTVKEQTDTNSFVVLPQTKQQAEKSGEKLYKYAEEKIDKPYTELKDAIKTGIKHLNKIAIGIKPRTAKQSDAVIKDVSKMLAAIAINDTFIRNRAGGGKSQVLSQDEYLFRVSLPRRLEALDRISKNENLLELANNLVNNSRYAQYYLHTPPNDVLQSIRQKIPNVEIVKKQQTDVQHKKLGETMKTAIADFDTEAKDTNMTESMTEKVSMTEKLFNRVENAITYLEGSISTGKKVNESNLSLLGSQVLAGLAVLKALQLDMASKKSKFTNEFLKNPDSLLKKATDDEKLKALAATMFAPDKLSETLNMDSKMLTDKLLEKMEKPLSKVFDVDVPSDVKNVDAENQRDHGDDVEELDIGG